MSKTQRIDYIRKRLKQKWWTYRTLLDNLKENDFGVSLRTLMRDIDYLRKWHRSAWAEQPNSHERGIEFRIQPRKKGANQALAPYRMSRIVQQLRQLNDQDVQSAVELLTQAYPMASQSVTITPEEMPYIEIGEFSGNDLNVTVLQHIVDAIQKPVLITFTYRGKKIEKRLPLRILEYKGRVYVITWAQLQKRYEPFRLDAISNVVHRGPTKLRKTFNFDEFMSTRFGLWEGSPAECVTVVVEIADLATARNFHDRTWHPSQRITDLDGGGIRIAMQCGLSPELDSWILHWTPKIKVVEPPELHQRINDLHRRGLDETHG